MRRTKIIATLGPACDSDEILTAMIQAGVNVLRVNFSHANETVGNTIARAKSIAKILDRPLAIMADLQGPKLRIGRFKTGETTLISGQNFILDCNEQAELGDNTRVSVAYTALYKDIKIDDHILLDDGLLELKVTAIKARLIHCLVIEGGRLRDKKGLNRKGGGLSAGALTEKDKQDLITAVNADVDYVSLSFVKNQHDITEARQLLKAAGHDAMPIIAKIERVEALHHLNEIIMSCEGIMVARGDLAVEVGAQEVPAIQKKLVELTRHHDKIAIVATQMMESMITQPQPTRAEVSDVANAILDGTDAVMLSAETASGAYPVKVIQMVDSICLATEKHARGFFKQNSDACHYQRPDQAIALAAMHTANHFPLKAIVALTESGASALWMSRYQSEVPIIAVTCNIKTYHQLSLVSNIIPVLMDYKGLAILNINQTVIDFLLTKKLLKLNTQILITRGRSIGTAGGTNSLEIYRVGEEA